MRPLDSKELSRIMAISQKRAMLCNPRGQQRYYREAIRLARPKN
jgi:hypothetical protein